MQKLDGVLGVPGRVWLVSVVVVAATVSCKDKPAAPAIPRASSVAASSAPTTVASVPAGAGASSAPDTARLRDIKAWARTLGSTSLDESAGLVVDRDGSVIVAGKFNGTVDFGGGPKTSAGSADVYLVKFDPSGSHVWSRSFGGSDEDEVRSLALDGAGNLVVAGVFYGTMNPGSGPIQSHGLTDAFVASFGPDGTPRWAKALGGRGYDTSLGVTVDVQGNTVVTGNFKAKAEFGGEPVETSGHTDAFLVKLGIDGSHLWSRSLSAGREAHGWHVAADRQGNVFMAGDFYGTIDAGGTKLKSQSTDLFLAKYDKTGSQAWVKRFGGAVEDHGSGLAIDAQDNLVWTGWFSKEIDFGGGRLPAAGASGDVFVTKLDSSGDHLWSHAYGGLSGNHSEAVVIGPEGSIFVTGSYAKNFRFGGEPLTCAGMSDAFVLALAADGATRWTRTWGGAEDDSGAAVGVDRAGAVTVTGFFHAAADFGAGPVRSVGNQDVFIVRLPPQ